MSDKSKEGTIGAGITEKKSIQQEPEWERIWEQLGSPDTSGQDEIWKRSAERIRQENPRELLEGHRSEQQGE